MASHQCEFYDVIQGADSWKLQMGKCRIYTAFLRYETFCVL